MKLLLIPFTFALSLSAMASSSYDCQLRTGKSTISKDVALTLNITSSEIIITNEFNQEVTNYDLSLAALNSTRTGEWLTIECDKGDLTIEASGEMRRLYLDNAFKCFQVL